MKRTIYIITLGYILGIIGELLINKVSLFICVLIFITVLIKYIKLEIKNNFFRIINVFIKNNTILIFLVSALIGSIRLNYCNNKYQFMYNNFKADSIKAIVLSTPKEEKYNNTYKVKLTNNKFKNIYFLLKVPQKLKLDYGDKIEFDGEYFKPEVARNYKAFDYSKYLKSQNIFGTIKTNKVDIISKNNVNIIFLVNNNIKQKIINNIRNILPEDTKELALGILIGYDENLQGEILKFFSKSSLNHLLAVSGLHITYLSIGILFLFEKKKISKTNRIILLSIFLINFIVITDFSSSSVRAGIMTIIMLFSLVVHRKNDIKTTLSIPILVILICNPYKILDIGLILSYLATIGIITGQSLISKAKQNNKIKRYIIDTLKISILTNIFIIPILALNFNTISFSFIISSLIVGIIIGPVVIGGFILIIFSFINFKFASIYSTIYNLFPKTLIIISKLISKIPFSQILITTPNWINIIFYYLIIYILILYKFLSKNFSNRYLVRKIIEFKENLYLKLKKNLKQIIIFLLVIVIVCLDIQIIPGKLKIYFIDVGQGDSCLIVTPNNKKILIDGGGDESYDVGKNILVPYLLDRKIKKIDYVIVSHFDTDHVRSDYLLRLKN